MSFERVRQTFALLLAVALLSFVFAACSSDEDETGDESDNTSQTAGPKYTPSGNEGQITGTIALNGTAPEAKTIPMDADPVCAQHTQKTEEVVANGGKLANVFIYIKDGKTADGKPITNMSWDVPGTEVTLDQHGCHYVPHVLGIMAGQKLKIVNSDQTAHNIHPLPKSNPEWNESQPSGSEPKEKTFLRPEVVIPVKCNQHPWMKAYIGVMRSPLYAVSGDDGHFTIQGVPPGTYTVAALHEKYGEKTMTVTVGAKEIKTQDYSFDAAATAQAQPFGGALHVEPALEVPMPMAMPMKHQ